MAVLINPVHQVQRVSSGPAWLGGSRFPCMAIPMLADSFQPSPASDSIAIPSPVASMPREWDSSSREWRGWGTQHGSARGTLEVT